MMNQASVIKAVKETTGYTQKDIAAVLDAVEAVVVTGLQKDEEVKLFSGLTLGTKVAPARKARNPRTGEEFMTEAKKKVYVKLGAGLKNKVLA